MKILVTGSGGFIGQHILGDILKTHDVVRFVGDICNYGNVLSQVPKDVDVIINLAGVISANDKTMVDVNILGLQNLIEAVKKNVIDLKLFIQIGSAAEYLPSGNIIKEANLKSPVNFYGHTKLMASKMVESWSKMHNQNALILRPFSVIGKNQPKNMLPAKLQTIFAVDSENIIVDNVNMSSVRDWIDVRDLSRTIVDLLDFRNGFAEVNIGNGVGIDNKTLVNEFAYHAGKTFTYNSTTYPTDSLIADISVLKTILPEWRTVYTIQDSIKYMFD